MKWDRVRYTRHSYGYSRITIEPRFGVAGGWRSSDAFVSEVLLALRLSPIRSALYVDAASILGDGWHDYFGRYALHVEALPFNYGVVAEQTNGNYLGGLRVIAGSFFLDHYWVLAGDGEAVTQVTANISF